MEQIPLVDFRADEFVRMSIEDRIRQCRALADEAKYFATVADREMRGDYIGLSQHWSELADELTRQAK
jgi:hypothetical protein